MGAKKTPEQFLEEARARIGEETETITAPYPVEYEPLARYAMMVDDTNPIYTDPDYARGTKYGDVIAPPFVPFGIMPRDFSMFSVIPPLPGPFFINMAQEWEWMKPVKVGDRLSYQTRLADVHIKGISIDPKAFWVTFETRISNQNGEVACIYKNILLNHRTSDEVAQDVQ